MTKIKLTIIAALIFPIMANAASVTTHNLKEQLPPKAYKVLNDLYPIGKFEKQGGIHFENKFQLKDTFYMVSLGDSTLAISKDGENIIGGDVVNLSKKVNYTEQAKEQARSRVVNAITKDDYIRYPSTTNKTKGVVYIYSDITCGFCKKLHQEYSALTSNGYEIRVVPFLRNLGAKDYQFSKAYLDTVAMMSIQDPVKRKEAHDLLLTNKPITQGKGNPKGVKSIINGANTGVLVGVQGTPHIVFADGRSFSGYVSSELLLKVLNSK